MNWAFGNNCSEEESSAVKWRYEGELDINGLMCGFGRLLYYPTNFKLTGSASNLGYNDYKGTFLNDMFHGFGSQKWPFYIYEGEYSEGCRSGHATLYFYDGSIYNMKFEEGEAMTKELVTDNKKAWFGEGEPIFYGISIPDEEKFPDAEDETSEQEEDQYYDEDSGSD